MKKSVRRTCGIQMSYTKLISGFRANEPNALRKGISDGQTQANPGRRRRSLPEEIYFGI